MIGLKIIRGLVHRTDIIDYTPDRLTILHMNIPDQNPENLPKSVDSQKNIHESAPPVLLDPQSPSSVGSKSSKPGDIPASGIYAGILMILALPVSGGVIFSLEPFFGGLLIWPFLGLWLLGVVFSFARRRSLAVACVSIFVIITGLNAFLGLFSLLDNFPSDFSKLLNRLLYHSVFGFLLGLWTLWNLRKNTLSAKCE